MPVVHLSTDAFSPVERVSRFQDELARHLVSGDAAVMPEGARPFRVTWSLVAGVNLALVTAEVAELSLQRRGRLLRDGDGDHTLFTAVRQSIRFDHNGRHGLLTPGQGMLVSHTRASEICWRDAGFSLVHIPRAALPDADAAEAAAGKVLPRNHPVLRLLRAYQRSVWSDATADGLLPASAERTLAALVGSFAATSNAVRWRTLRPALGPARVAAMQEVVARRSAEPDLGMGEVAAAVGLSERSGHLLFEAAGLQFSHCLAQARLTRAQAQLSSRGSELIIDIAMAAGFGDISHFNRLFRKRFGMTPSDMRARSAAADGSPSEDRVTDRPVGR